MFWLSLTITMNYLSHLNHCLHLLTKMRNHTVVRMQTTESPGDMPKKINNDDTLSTPKQRDKKSSLSG